MPGFFRFRLGYYHEVLTEVFSCCLSPASVLEDAEYSVWEGEGAHL